MARRLPALGSPVYRWFLLSSFIGTMGSFMQGTSQGWLVLSITNSPGLLSLTTAAQNAPMLFLSMLAGALADQVNRRHLLVAAELGGALISVGLAVLTMTGTVAFWHVVVLAMLTGSVQALAFPSLQSILPTIVNRGVIGSAIALNSAIFNVARILGPAVAGLAIAAGGLVLGFWANAVTFLAVAFILARLPIPARTTDRVEASLWSNLLAGFRYVRSEPMIGLIVLMAGVPALFVLNLFTLLPVYARDILEIGAPGLGLLLSAVGIGALVGAGTYAVALPGGGSGRLMLGGLGFVGILLAIFAVSRWLPLSLLALVIYGASQVAFYSTAQSLLQNLAAPRMRGRVMSLYLLTALGAAPLGNLLAGLVAETLGVQWALGGGGVLTLVAVAAVWLGSPRLVALRPDRVTA